MALRIDPELLEVLSGSATATGPPVGDVDSRRKNLSEGFAAIAASRDSVPGVDRTDFSTITNDGATLELSWYQHTTIEPPGSAVLYFHGGGFIVSLLPSLRRDNACLHQSHGRSDSAG